MYLCISAWTSWAAAFKHRCYCLRPCFRLSWTTSFNFIESVAFMYWEWRRDVALFLIAPCSSNAIAAYILCARLLHLLPSATQHIRTCLLILKECLGTSPENDMNDRHSGYKNYYFRHQQLFLPPSIQERTCFSIPLPLDYPGANEMSWIEFPVSCP